MSDISPKNIRNTLKVIYSQFAENKIEDFIFTTYDFDIDFFEEHIVSFLMNTKRKITTVKDLNEANKWLKDNNVSVYYDNSALSADRPCTTLRIYPQKKPRPYVFHPKVIIM